MGAAVGMALVGQRPIVEMRFSDFALCATDELINQAAKARYMFGGQGRVPLVARLPIGMWRSSAAQHSQSLEAWYAHMPGPRRRRRRRRPPTTTRCSRASIATDDPVVYMEHKDLWGLEGDVPDNHRVELGRARIALRRRRRDDRDVVQIRACRGPGRTRPSPGEGIGVEVIDLRTLWPWDRDAVFASVARTGRLLVVHEAVQAGGFGAEIAATVAEAMDGELKAPVRRLGAPRIPVAYAPPLEDLARVTADHVLAAARELVAQRPSQAQRGRVAETQRSI